MLFYSNTWNFSEEYRMVLKVIEIMPHLIVNIGLTEQETRDTFMVLLNIAIDSDGDFTMFSRTQKSQIERHYRDLATTGRIKNKLIEQWLIPNKYIATHSIYSPIWISLPGLRHFFLRLFLPRFPMHFWSLQMQLLPYKFEGEVVRGFGRGGKELGCPTANMDETVVNELPEGLAVGVYYGKATFEGKVGGSCVEVEQENCSDI